MSPLRSGLRLLAAFVVAMQLATPAFASAALCCKPSSAVAVAVQADEVMDCCKKGGAHICPLKKSSGTPADKASSSRPDHAIRSCCSPDARLFAALLGAVGLPAVEPIALVGPDHTAVIPRTVAAEPLWSARSTSPPPKA